MHVEQPCRRSEKQVDQRAAVAGRDWGEDATAGLYHWSPDLKIVGLPVLTCGADCLHRTPMGEQVGNTQLARLRLLRLGSQTTIQLSEMPSQDIVLAAHPATAVVLYASTVLAPWPFPPSPCPTVAAVPVEVSGRTGGYRL